MLRLDAYDLRVSIEGCLLRSGVMAAPARKKEEHATPMVRYKSGTGTS